MTRGLWTIEPLDGVGSIADDSGAKLPVRQRHLRLLRLRVAASHFNWLMMSDPLNRAMLLGDAAIPGADALRRHVAEGVRVFLAAYATRPPQKRQVKPSRHARRRPRA